MLFLGELGRRFGFDGHPHLLGLGAPLPFLFGPLLFLYVIALTRPLVLGINATGQFRPLMPPFYGTLGVSYAF